MAYLDQRVPVLGQFIFVDCNSQFDLKIQCHRGSVYNRLHLRYALSVAWI